MLSSTELCYCPWGGILRPVLLSTELCYRPQGYVIVNRAMLLSMWWYSQTHVIFHRAMLLSTGVCYRPQSYVIVHVVLFSDLCYRPQSYVIIHRAMLSSTELCYCPCGGILSCPVDDKIAHLAAVAATRVWIPASCQILYIKYRIKTRDGVRKPGNKKFYLKNSVVDPDPHGSGTFAWIRIRNYCSGSWSS